MLIGLYSSTPQCGKGEIAAYLQVKRNFKIYTFAAPLKKICVEFLVAVGIPHLDAVRYCYTDKEAQIPGFPDGVTGRHLQRTMGTDWGQNLVDPLVWTKAQARLLDANGAANCVFDDLRAEDEYEMLRQRGALFIWVRRDNAYDGPLSCTDGRLDGYIPSSFHAIIENNDTIPKLRQQVDNLFATHPQFATCSPFKAAV